MPSFSDSIFLFILALLLFGPKKLPQLARELGKWVGEFRRASNEFKMQMEEELRVSEQAERQKEIAAMEAAAPVTPPLPAETAETEITAAAEQPILHAGHDVNHGTLAEESDDNASMPLPIAVSGELKIMPPSTGLPKPREENGDALGGLLDSIPVTDKTAKPMEESAAHAD